MTNIKTFKELRKLFKNTDWLSLKFCEEEIINLFDEEVRDEFYQKYETKDEYYFNENKLEHRIDKKTQSDVYRLRFLRMKNEYCNTWLYHSFEAVKNPKSFSVYEVAENTGGGTWCKYIPTDTKFWVDDYTDQLLYVRYKREDVWFNNFFRISIDSSIPNNYDEIHKEKIFYLAHGTITKKVSG